MNTTKDYRGPKKVDQDNLLSCLRAHFYLSQQHLADLCDVPLRSLQKLENGDFSIGFDVPQHVAQYFGIPVHALIHASFEEVYPLLTAPPVLVQPNESFLKKVEMASEIGAKGEKLVEEWERRKLAGTSYAALVSTEPSKHPMLGYDVISYTQDGRPLHIEVKTTTQACDRAFYMSAIEMKHMLDCMAHEIAYELHRVYYVNDSSLCAAEIYRPQQLLELFDFVPCDYAVKKKVIAA